MPSAAGAEPVRSPSAGSLHGRRFAAAGPVAGGDVSTETVFHYFQDGDLVWARYGGGAVRLGHLTGTRTEDRLHFRYSHLTTDGQTAAGRCDSVVRTLPDGRLQLDETWAWESRPGQGSSTLEELPVSGPPGVLGLAFAATGTLRRAETAEFFASVLGLGRLPDSATGGIDADLFTLPDGSTFAVTSPRSIPGGHSVGFLVADLDDACRRLRQAGVEVDTAQANSRDRYVHFVAPDGETYELVERLT